MTPQAIAQRWKNLGQLYDFGMSLKTAKYLGPVKSEVLSSRLPAASEISQSKINSAETTVPESPE